MQDCRCDKGCTLEEPHMNCENPCTWPECLNPERIQSLLDAIGIEERGGN